MRYVAINAAEAPKSELTNEYKSGTKYGNVIMGENYLFLKYGFSLFYIAYANLKYAFRRVMVVPFNKKKEIQVDYLIIADKRKELASIKLAGHNIAVEIMEELKKRSPETVFTCPERLKR